MLEPTTDISHRADGPVVSTSRAARVGVRLWHESAARLPLVPFMGVYFVTCYAGALALLGSEGFRSTYVVFSGAQGPDLFWGEIARILILLHAGPLLLWAGYEAALWWAAPRLPAPRDLDRAVRAWWPRLLMAVPVAIAVWSLTRSGGWEGFGAWNDYNAYVHARLRMFDTLGFFEFVSLYTWLPLAGAYVLLVERRRLVAAAAIAAVLLLQYPLAQRKVLLTSTVLMLFAIYVHEYVGSAPRRRASIARHVKWAAMATFLLYVTYLGLTFLAIASPDSKPYTSLQNVTPHASRTFPHDKPAPVVSFALDDRTVARLKDNRVRALALYLFFAPLTRTSITAIAYPVIFPAIQPFYPVDLGLDVLRIGRMPDDNLVVYRFLWPEHDRGAVAAPFHVALYSQGGMLVACVGSLVVGFALALAWSRIFAVATPSTLRSLFGSLLLVLAMFLALDAGRNAMIVSYGVIWGMLPLGLAAGVQRARGVTSGW